MMIEESKWRPLNNEAESDEIRDMRLIMYLIRGLHHNADWIMKNRISADFYRLPGRLFIKISLATANLPSFGAGFKPRIRVITL
jgi:hypothetical protein